MTLYLNNEGSRWVSDDMRFVLVLPTGVRKVRKARYFYSLGNFAGVAYTLGRKLYRGLPKAADGCEARLPDETGIAALPHIFHKG